MYVGTPFVCGAHVGQKVSGPQELELKMLSVCPCGCQELNLYLKSKPSALNH